MARRESGEMERRLLWEKARKDQETARLDGIGLWSESRKDEEIARLQREMIKHLNELQRFSGFRAERDRRGN